MSMIRIKDASLQIKIYEDNKVRDDNRKLTLVKLRSATTANRAPILTNQPLATKVNPQKIQANQADEGLDNIIEPEI